MGLLLRSTNWEEIDITNQMQTGSRHYLIQTRKPLSFLYNKIHHLLVSYKTLQVGGPIYISTVIFQPPPSYQQLWCIAAITLKTILSYSMILSCWHPPSLKGPSPNSTPACLTNAHLKRHFSTKSFWFIPLPSQNWLQFHLCSSYPLRFLM